MIPFLTGAALAGPPVVGFALAGLPLLEAPGWELGMAAALLAALAGAPVGVAAARREMARPVPSAVRAFLRAAAWLAGIQLLLVAGAILRTAFLSPCSPTFGLPFVPVVALPSALVAAGLGTLSGFLSRGRTGRGTAIYATLALASLTASLLEGWAGPASYLLDPLLGVWPGPIYDEALALDARIGLFRLASLGWAAALAALSALVLARRRTPPGGTWGPAVALAAALTAVACVRVAGAWSGDLATRATIDRFLGGRLAGAHCDLHFPREKPAADVARLLRDCDADVAEVAGALGVSPAPRVTVWLHRSEAEKRRLVGAGRTEFTKPWLGEIQVLDAPGGPPALRHEIVHAVSARIAGGPLGVPARAWVLVDGGLLEGLAVALDVPRGEWTTHEWARAMRKLGLLPPAARLVEPAGFFSAPAARAYGASGSFLAFLLGRHGAAPVVRAYAGTPFAEAFGTPMATLEQEWHAFLGAAPVPPALEAAAELRFRPAGLFGRRCARETAGLEVRAGAASRAGRPADAAALWRRAARLSGDPNDLRGAGDALRSSDPAGASAVYEEALGALGTGAPAVRAAIRESQGDLAARAGNPGVAVTRYQEALALLPERPRERLLLAKIDAITDPALAPVLPYLVGTGDAGAALSAASTSTSALGPYLAGRAAAARGDASAAIPLLERALSGRLPSVAFEVEALQTLAAARCDRGDRNGARAAWAEVVRVADREADRERARHAARRCGVELASGTR